MIDGRRGRREGAADAGGGDREEGPGSPGAAVTEATAEAARSSHQKHSLGLARLLAGLGVSADHVTVVGILIAAGAGLSLATGRFWVGIVLLTVGGLMDTLDGAVAKAAGTSSRRGAFFDSVSDRVADAFIFAGLAWYFAAGPGRDPKLALLPVAILAVGNAISYERAKAESLGFVAKGGLMERAERLILLGLALLTHLLLVPLLWLSLALCLVTATQRFAKVWRQAAPEVAQAGEMPATVHAATPGATPAWRPGRVESRWRAWREANAGAARSPRRVVLVSRARSRRREEPLTTRVRRVLTTERIGVRSTRGGRPARQSSARADRRQQGTAAALRRRLGNSR
jgi:CDP-diacylglycerol--glycerol-3-phosphate 3-phosphatidyltransferase